MYNISKLGITKTNTLGTTELVKYDFVSQTSEDDPFDIFELDNTIRFTVYKNNAENTMIDINSCKDKTTYLIQQFLSIDNIASKNLAPLYFICYYPTQIITPLGLTYNYELTDFKNRWYNGNEWANHKLVSKMYEEADGERRNETSYEFNYSVDRKKCIVTFNSAKATYSDSRYITTKIYSDRISQRTINDRGYEKETTYTYCNSWQYSPASEINEVTDLGSTSATNVKTYEYDKYKLKKETYNGKIVNYTYDDKYAMLTKKEYNKDANTKVKIENILTADKKSVAQQNIYQNNNLVSTVNYTYDSYGNVSGQSQTVGTQQIEQQYNTSYSQYGDTTVSKTVMSVADADGANAQNVETQTIINNFGYPMSETDGNGNITQYNYDLLGRLMQKTNAENVSENYVYDVAGKTTTYTDPNGGIRRVVFDAWGNKQKVQSKSDTSFDTHEQFTYDEYNRLKTYTLFYSPQKYLKAEYSYNYLDMVISEKLTDNNSNTLKTTSHDYAFGKDSNGYTTITVTKTVAANDYTPAAEKITYDCYGNVIKKRLVSSTGERCDTYLYDLLGNVISHTDPMGNTETFTYDIFGNNTSHTNTEGDTEYNSYDALKRLVSHTDFNNNQTTYAYDTLGRNISVTSPLNSDETSYAKYYYDNNGNMTRKAVRLVSDDEEEQYMINDYIYNALNRLICFISYPTDTTAEYTQYFYDNNGNVTDTVTGNDEIIQSLSEASDNAAIVHNDYDSLNRLVMQTDAIGKYDRYSYDLNGNIITYNNGALPTVMCEYDALGNLTKKYCSSIAAEYTYNSSGLKTSMADETGTTNYQYNAFGNLTYETKDDIIKTYLFDNMNRCTRFKISKGGTEKYNVGYQYNTLGKITSVTSGSNTNTYQYDKNGNILKMMLNDEVRYRAKYNAANLATKIFVSAEGQYEDAYTMSYNQAGQCVGKIDSVGGDLFMTLYKYDKAGRLILQNGPDCSKFYTYDNRGNRKSQKTVTRLSQKTETENYVYDLSNRLKQINKVDTNNNSISQTNYYYNTINGVRKIVTSYADESIPDDVYKFWINGFGNIRRSAHNDVDTFYKYDGNGIRESKTTNDVKTTHIYFGDNVVMDIAGDDIYTFVRGNELLYSMKNGAQMKNYRINQHGDVTRLSDGNTPVNDYKYDSFGNVYEQSGSEYNPFTYCGEYFDTETNFVYLRNRYYEPSTGRFTQPDPAKDGTNWYVYCNSDPINYKDPQGLKCQLIGNKQYWSATFNDMQILTDDRLEFDEKTGNVTIGSYGNGKMMSGTKLTRELIESKNFNLLIARNAGNGNGLSAASKNGATIDIRDVNSSDEMQYFLLKNEDEETFLQSASKTPVYIALAHEMIHAYHHMNGDFNKNKGGKHIFFYNNMFGKEYIKTSRNDDEYSTVGLPFISLKRLPGSRSMNPYYIQSTYSDITENMIRREHNLPYRMAYSLFNERGEMLK